MISREISSTDINTVTTFREILLHVCHIKQKSLDIPETQNTLMQMKQCNDFFRQSSFNCAPNQASPSKMPSP